MGLDAAVTGLQAAVLSALQASSIAAQLQPIPGQYGSGQVGVGWPTGPDLTEILTQVTPEWQVTVFPIAGTARNVTRYRPFAVPAPAPNVPLTATIANNLLVFGGSCVAGLNVYVFVSGTQAPAHYQTVAGDTPATVAQHVSDAINGLGYSGVSAVATNQSVTVTGLSGVFRFTIGGQGQFTAYEVARFVQNIGVNVWANRPDVRSALSNAITSVIGTIANAGTKFIGPLSDGTYARVRAIGGDNWNDNSQSSYNLYEAHPVFDVEYAITNVVPVYQVGAAVAATTENGGATTVEYTAGD